MVKRRIFGIPVAVIILFMLVTGGALAAYLVMTITGTVTTEEGISVAPTTFSATLKPNETASEIITVTNSSTEDIDVILEISVDPPVGLTVDLSDASMVIPGSGSDTFTIDTTMDNDAAPGVFTITVGVSR